MEVQASVYNFGMYRDDDDLDDPIRSHADALTRADQGKQEQRERKAERKGKLNQLKLQTLRQRVESKKPEEEKNQKKEEKKVETFGTKTRKDEERAAIDTANVKPGPDQLIQKASLEEAEQKQAGIEEDKDQTG